jgi:hypothetical protein
MMLHCPITLQDALRPTVGLVKEYMGPPGNFRATSNLGRSHPESMGNRGETSIPQYDILADMGKERQRKSSGRDRPSDREEFYTASEAAKVLGMTNRRVRALAQEGRIEESGRRGDGSCSAVPSIPSEIGGGSRIVPQRRLGRPMTPGNGSRGPKTSNDS